MVMASAIAHHIHDPRPIPTSPPSASILGPNQRTQAIPRAAMGDSDIRGGLASQSPEAEGGDYDSKHNAAGDGQNGASSNSDGGPSRKRRRSRKGLDKRFECTAEGCGKSYSRAEHL